MFYRIYDDDYSQSSKLDDLQRHIEPLAFKRKGKCEISFYQRTDAFRQIDESHVKIIGIKKPVKCSSYSIPKGVCNTRVTFKIILHI